MRLVQRWEQSLRAAGRAANTIRLYSYTVRELPEITADAIGKYLEDQIARNSRATANTKLQAIRAFVRWAEGHGHLEGILAHLPSRIHAPDAQPRVPSREEVDKLAGALRDKHKLAVFLMADAGLRVSEVTGLRVADVDLEQRIMRVVGKGNRARSVPLVTKRLRAAVKRAVIGAKPEDYVVPGQGGTRMDTSNIRKVLAHACEQEGISPIHPHALRHSFAAQSATHNVPLPILQSVLGHGSLEVTQQYLRSLGRPEELVRGYAGFDG